MGSGVLRIWGICIIPTQCGAVSFIENVRAKNLMLPEEEFNMKMGYVNGKTDIDLFLEESAAEEEEDQERTMVLEVRERGREGEGDIGV